MGLGWGGESTPPQIHPSFKRGSLERRVVVWLTTAAAPAAGAVANEPQQQPSVHCRAPGLQEGQDHHRRKAQQAGRSRTGHSPQQSKLQSRFAMVGWRSCHRSKYQRKSGRLAPFWRDGCILLFLFPVLCSAVWTSPHRQAEKDVGQLTCVSTSISSRNVREGPSLQRMAAGYFENLAAFEEVASRCSCNVCSRDGWADKCGRCSDWSQRKRTLLAHAVFPAA